MSDNPLLRGPSYQIEADIVERARHEWAHMRPISPDLIIALIAEIERLRSLADEMGRVNIKDQKEIQRLRVALGMCPVSTTGKHVWAIFPIGPDGRMYHGPHPEYGAAGAFCQLCQIPRSPYHDTFEDKP
jgi:hypothetical protein